MDVFGGTAWLYSYTVSLGLPSDTDAPVTGYVMSYLCKHKHEITGACTLSQATIVSSLQYTAGHNGMDCEIHFSKLSKDKKHLQW